jgi:hypothetical protein
MRRMIQRRRVPASRQSTAEIMERRLLMSTYTVNTLSDAIDPVAGQLTLRQAVSYANLHAGADTIVFDPTVFPAGSSQTITLLNGPISFTDTSGSTTVTGPGSAALAVNGNQTSRVFQVSSGVAVSMSGLTITNGAVNSSAGVIATGGGIQNGGSLTLTNVTVSDNLANGGSYPDIEGGATGNGGAADGAGIYSTGNLVLVNTVISGNTAQGGNSYYQPTTNYFSDPNVADGGGIYCTGSLTISGGAISNNNAFGGVSEYPEGGVCGEAEGGGIYVTGQLSIASTTVSGNTATGGSGGQVFSVSDEAGGANASGGGIYASGTSTINGSSFSDNQAQGGTSGAESGGAGIGSGGAIFSDASLTVDSCSMLGNRASGGGGPSDDNGPGSNGFGGAIAAEGPLNVLNSQLSSNLAIAGNGEAERNNNIEASGYGGAIYSTQSMVLTGSTITGNTAEAVPGGQYAGQGGNGEGGGVYTAGMATISSSSLNGNAAIGGPGDYTYGYSTTAGIGGSGLGGAIFNGGTLAVNDSTLSGNQATGGQGGQQTASMYGGPGGGAGGGGIFSSGKLTLSTCTVSGNDVIGGNGGIGGYNGANGGYAQGGGVYESGILTISESTLVGNSTRGGQPGPSGDSLYYVNGSTGVAEGGGIYAGKNSLLDNSIISANNAASGADVYSSLSTASAYNLIGYGASLTNGVNGNQIGVHDPMLSALGNYGGPTETMLPLAGSPVIDAGSNSLIPAGVTTDQRGYGRIVGTSVDIGAVEYTASVSGTVFNDLNGDGVRQTNEPGLAGVIVYADLNDNGVFEPGDPSATTDASGNYVLNGLPAGTVIIRQEISPGNRQSYPLGGGSENVTVSEQVVTGANFAQSTDLYISGSVTLNGVGQSGVIVYADLNNDGKFEAGENNKTTASDGSFAFTGLAAGTYTLRMVLPAGDIQTSPANNAGITLTLTSGSVEQGLSFTLAKQSTATPLTGTVIGTSGSYSNQGNTAAKAFDGNLNTFFDAPTASGSYAGLDLGSAKVITSISYAPRSGWASRMVDGVFQASNSPTFSTGVVTLYTVTAVPAVGVLTTVTLSNTAAFRYVRYMGPANSFCNIAEAQFFGSMPAAFTGTVIGTLGSYNNQGNTIANAEDGNLSTYFDAPAASGSWVGLDLGSAKVVTEVEYAPRSGWASRMVGGEIQASNSATFSSGVVTLLTIGSTPATGVLTTQLLTNTTAYRYYRYIGPANSFCNIAELEFLQ